MELDELKTAWTQYNVNLEKNLKLNEEILREIKLGKAKSEMKTPLRYDISNVILIFLILIFLLFTLQRHSAGTNIFIVNSIGVFCYLILLFIYIKRVLLFNSINFDSLSILTVQKQMIKVKEKYNVLKFFELLLIPFAVFSLGVLLVEIVKGFNLLNYLHGKNLIVIITTIVLTIFLMLWTFKHLYKKKFQNTENFLKEIEEFEKER